MDLYMYLLFLLMLGSPCSLFSRLLTNCPVLLLDSCLDPLPAFSFLQQRRLGTGAGGVAVFFFYFRSRVLGLLFFCGCSFVNFSLFWACWGTAFLLPRSRESYPSCERKFFTHLPIFVIRAIVFYHWIETLVSQGVVEGATVGERSRG